MEAVKAKHVKTNINIDNIDLRYSRYLVYLNKTCRLVQLDT